MLKRTPLFDAHRALGAKIVPFAGWEMPVQYEGILAEHKAVREIVFRGPDARAAVQKLVTNDVGKLVDGKAMYTLVCYPDGGIVDDCIVYRRGAEDLIIVVNASNADKDFAWMDENTHAAKNESEAWGLLAVQGPHAVALVSKLAEKDLT